MTRVFIDTNFILNIALKRDPFFEHTTPEVRNEFDKSSLNGL